MDGLQVVQSKLGPSVKIAPFFSLFSLFVSLFFTSCPYFASVSHTPSLALLPSPSFPSFPPSLLPFLSLSLSFALPSVSHIHSISSFSSNAHLFPLTEAPPFDVTGTAHKHFVCLKTVYKKFKRDRWYFWRVT